MAQIAQLITHRCHLGIYPQRRIDHIHYSFVNDTWGCVFEDRHNNNIELRRGFKTRNDINDSYYCGHSCSFKVVVYFSTMSGRVVIYNSYFVVLNSRKCEIVKHQSDSPRLSNNANKLGLKVGIYPLNMPRGRNVHK